MNGGATLDSPAVVEFDNVSFRYPRTHTPTIERLDLRLCEGELVVVVGPTGCGKTTMLRCINGLVPHFSGGTLSGSVAVAGRSTEAHPPRELADLVGFVPQNPADSFVCDTVEEELAYAMENLGVAPVVMRRRVEETLDLLSIVHLRDRATTTLSGGEQQRVAIAAVLTAAPRLLVLDEPTSSLDPAAAEEVLAAITRLVHDVGLTVVVAEHRLERVAHLADRIVVMGGPSIAAESPADAMAWSPVAPPVVELGRIAGWEPLPLSIRDARRRAPGLRDRLGIPPSTAERANPISGTVTATVDHLTVRFDRHDALRGMDLAFDAGQVTAVMGRNGAGKSTLLGALAGMVSPTRGSVRLHAEGGRAEDPSRLRGRTRIALVGLVPQDPSILLCADSVEEECRLADKEGHLAAGSTRTALERLVPGIDPAPHPLALSEGQRLGVALAVVMAHEPRIVLLDEPTRGLDYATKARLAGWIAVLSESGVTVVMATHDVELAATVAHRVVVLSDGEVIADGPARDVVCHSTVFAPQVAKIMAPDEWLTVAEIEAGLATS